jgi:hypothetical protein
MIASGSLDSDFRPSAFRPIICTRNSDGSVNVRMDFNADGGVTLVTGTPRITSATVNVSGFTSVVDPIDSTTADPVDGHAHGVVGGHDHSWSDSVAHSHGGFVDIGSPTWISLNGVEYFL